MSRLYAYAGETWYTRPVAKPGMQRDILVAYWLLFDEFEIGEDDPPLNTANQPDGPSPTAPNANRESTPPDPRPGRPRHNS